MTSRGAGLSVPDWPNSYGYNLFFFPVSHWVGGVLYEHTHRLVASGVGLLTTVLACWIWLCDPRRWLRWLGLAAFAGVVIQGVLGGLRVTLIADQLGIVHATLAQLFLGLVVAIAWFTSRWWVEGGPDLSLTRGSGTWLIAGTLLILLQLVLGATMRHQHAGLAIPDFPLAYGRLWPATDPAALAAYNQARVETLAANPITAFQIQLQLAHRFLGFLIVGWVSLTTRRLLREVRTISWFRRLAWLWFGLAWAQAGLGAATVWSGKSADIATAHVGGGALLLAVGLLLTISARRSRALALAQPPIPADPWASKTTTPARSAAARA